MWTGVSQKRPRLYMFIFYNIMTILSNICHWLEQEGVVCDRHWNVVSVNIALAMARCYCLWIDYSVVNDVLSQLTQHLAPTGWCCLWIDCSPVTAVFQLTQHWPLLDDVSVAPRQVKDLKEMLDKEQGVWRKENVRLCSICGTFAVYL